jgi:hypothetical protein
MEPKLDIFFSKRTVVILNGSFTASPRKQSDQSPADASPTPAPRRPGSSASPGPPVLREPFGEELRLVVDRRQVLQLKKQFGADAFISLLNT